MKRVKILTLGFIVFNTWCCKNNESSVNTKTTQLLLKPFIENLGKNIAVIDTTQFIKITRKKVCEGGDCWNLVKYYWDKNNWVEVDGGDWVMSVKSNSNKCFENSIYSNLLEQSLFELLKKNQNLTIDFDSNTGYYLPYEKNVLLFFDNLDNDIYKEIVMIEDISTYRPSENLLNCKVNSIQIIKLGLPPK